MTNQHGDFIWYELLTTDADGARDFYGKVIGWDIETGPSGDIDYRMISTANGPVAGLMPLTPDMIAGGAHPAWLGYVGVEDVDAMVQSYRDGSGKVHAGPRDIPGVGRFALLSDPQGAMLYVMRPTPPADNPDAARLSFSYDTPRIGHCAWNELMTSDPGAALHFHAQRFGWVKDGGMDMGPLGEYSFLRHTGHGAPGEGKGMIGAVMPMMPSGAPGPVWTYYFRVPDIDGAVAAIDANGGAVLRPPTEIPGGDFSMIARDPQGASFALVGGRA